MWSVIEDHHLLLWVVATFTRVDQALKEKNNVNFVFHLKWFPMILTWCHDLKNVMTLVKA